MWVSLAGVAAFLWLVPQVVRRRHDLSQFDDDCAERFGAGDHVEAELKAVFRSLRREAPDDPPKGRFAQMRERMDALFSDVDPDATITPIDAAGIRGEWVLAPGADPGRRVLYIHGGAFVMGSPLSHRTITAKFSQMVGGAVLSIDYRLMPEHPRMAGIDDCRTAYRWLLDNGPTGAAPAEIMFVAGDSAGGNLTLSLIAWIRDAGLRPPNAAVALSPSTDGTLSSPSWRTNLKTDIVLGRVGGLVAKVPATLIFWGSWLQMRVRPHAPVVSPIHGDLGGLPPLLVHASEVEMLRDDARRYVNRALAAGSPVRLQTWNHMLHVWHIFHPKLTAARDAFDQIEAFLTEHGPQRKG